MRPAVASGHPATTRAALDVLDAGGNAIDACVAAGFASAVAEPTLTSLAGGGFLLARTAEGEAVVFDFFVDTPGRGSGAADPAAALDFAEVVVAFSGADQSFHVGAGSVAVPGCLAGWLRAHERLGRLPLDEVVGPARRLAAEGVVVNEQQAYLLRILSPILARTPEGAAVFAPAGRPLAVGERLRNEPLGDLLGRLDPAGFAAPGLAGAIAAAMARDGGLVTEADLIGYRVEERTPLEVRWGRHRLLTNPPPAMGGELVALGLLLLEAEPEWPAVPGSPAHVRALVDAMVEADDIRARGATAAELVRRRSTGGTTHVSVSDAEGNVASMTTSNGEGSGWVVPGTGVMANNMLGEDDLHPGGFHSSPPGERVASMMAPSLVVGDDGAVELVIGSGGSKRIRTALLQVIAGVVDQGRDLADAVAAPRLHWDGASLHAEPGWSAAALAAARADRPVRPWDHLDLYFGGVHAVRPGVAAVGDPRRGGSGALGALDD